MAKIQNPVVESPVVDENLLVESVENPVVEAVKLDEFSLQNLINFKENEDVKSLFSSIGALVLSGKYLYKGEESQMESVIKDLPALLASMSADCIKKSLTTENPLTPDYAYDFIISTQANGKIQASAITPALEAVIESVNNLRALFGVKYEKPTNEKFAGVTLPH
jgi:hypothetical protein